MSTIIDELVVKLGVDADVAGIEAFNQALQQTSRDLKEVERDAVDVSQNFNSIIKTLEKLDQKAKQTIGTLKELMNMDGGPEIRGIVDLDIDGDGDGGLDKSKMIQNRSLRKVQRMQMEAARELIKGSKLLQKASTRLGKGGTGSTNKPASGPKSYNVRGPSQEFNHPITPFSSQKRQNESQTRARQKARREETKQISNATKQRRLLSSSLSGGPRSLTKAARLATGALGALGAGVGAIAGAGILAVAGAGLAAYKAGQMGMESGQRQLDIGRKLEMVGMSQSEGAQLGMKATASGATIEEMLDGIAALRQSIVRLQTEGIPTIVPDHEIKMMEMLGSKANKYSNQAVKNMSTDEAVNNRISLIQELWLEGTQHARDFAIELGDTFGMTAEQVQSFGRTATEAIKALDGSVELYFEDLAENRKISERYGVAMAKLEAVYNQLGNMMSVVLVPALELFADGLTFVWNKFAGMFKWAGEKKSIRTDKEEIYDKHFGGDADKDEYMAIMRNVQAVARGDSKWQEKENHSKLLGEYKKVQEVDRIYNAALNGPEDTYTKPIGEELESNAPKEKEEEEPIVPEEDQQNDVSSSTDIGGSGNIIVHGDISIGLSGVNDPNEIVKQLTNEVIKQADFNQVATG